MIFLRLIFLCYLSKTYKENVINDNELSQKCVFMIIDYHKFYK